MASSTSSILNVCRIPARHSVCVIEGGHPVLAIVKLMIPRAHVVPNKKLYAYLIITCEITEHFKT